MAWGDTARRRADIEARLRSNREHAHFSACLELFVHHYFHSNGWNVQTHPTMAHSPNHPDFLVDKHDGPILVECRSVFDREEISQQDQRLRQVTESVSRRLGRTVILQLLSDLPPNVPARRIRTWIEQQDISDDSAATDENLDGENELDQIAIDNILDTLAEVTLAIIRRRQIEQ